MGGVFTSRFQKIFFFVLSLKIPFFVLLSSKSKNIASSIGLKNIFTPPPPPNHFREFVPLKGRGWKFDCILIQSEGKKK